MSYLVLARKYRPQTFADIVGQEHVTRTLENAFARGRVHHAFLFCGARGVGKTTAARVLAKALCCEKGIGVACGECSACATITDGSAVDYHEIDGASNNSVDDIRELRDGVRYQPAQLRRKIYVIDEVHMLSTAAFNALLKTLEEPPPHVTFIFATTEVHKIPVTILSRCQRYDFKLVPTLRLVAHLESILAKEGISVDKAAAHLIARESGGSVRDSLSLTDQVIAYTAGERVTEAKVAEVLGVADRGLLVQLAGAVLGGDSRAALEAVDSAVDRGVDLAHLARTFLGTLRDLAVVVEIQDPTGLVDATEDEVAALRRLASGIARTHIVALFERFARACEDMRESPVPRLALEVALIDMAGSEPLAQVSELVERLEQMEKRLRGGGGSGPGAGGGGGARPPAPARTAPPSRPADVRATPAAVTAPVAAPSSLASAPPENVASAAPPLVASAPPENVASAAPPIASAAPRVSPAPQESPVAPASSAAPSASAAESTSAAAAEPVVTSAAAVPASGVMITPSEASASSPVLSSSPDSGPELVAKGQGLDAGSSAPREVRPSDEDPPVAVPVVPDTQASLFGAAASPAPTRRTPQDPMAEWERLVSAMEITLAGVYAHARLISWTETQVELGFAKGSLQAALGADTDKLAKVKALVAQVVGAPVDVKTRELAHMPPPSAASANVPGGSVPQASVAELDNERRRADREHRENEARQHPLTKAALDTFGATIKEIKLDV